MVWETVLKVQVGCLQKYIAKRLMMTKVIHQGRSSSISVLPNNARIKLSESFCNLMQRSLISQNLMYVLFNDYLVLFSLSLSLSMLHTDKAE